MLFSSVSTIKRSVKNHRHIEHVSLLHNVLHDFLFVQSLYNESEIWPLVCRGDNYEQNEIPLPPKNTDNAPSKVVVSVFPDTLQLINYFSLKA